MLVGGSLVRTQIGDRWVGLSVYLGLGWLILAYLTICYMLFIGSASRKDYNSKGNNHLRAKGAGRGQNE